VGTGVTTFYECIRFDGKKSAANKQKHGINFYEIQTLWDDLDLLEIPAKTVQDEGRCLVIGKIGKNHWSAVITYRDNPIRDSAILNIPVVESQIAVIPAMLLSGNPGFLLDAR